MSDPKNETQSAEPALGVPALEPAELRWTCGREGLSCPSTKEVEAVRGVIGQDAAVDALRFGLETRAPGQNVFVRGLVGTGRLTLVRSAMEELRTACEVSEDRCFVHNFSRPDRPRLIQLPHGRGRAFRRRMDALADFIRDDLARALGDERLASKRQRLEQDVQRQMSESIGPFEKALEEAGLGLVTVQIGPLTRPAIVPLVDGKPQSPEEFEEARRAGQISDEEFAALEEKIAQFGTQLEQVTRQVATLRQELTEQVQSLEETEARTLLDGFVQDLERAFPIPEVRTYLGELVDDVVDNAPYRREGDADPTVLYRVNVLLARDGGVDCPIVTETSPTIQNLLGTIDREVGPDGRPNSNHMLIRAGALLRADNGFLVLEARDVLTEPGAWKVLMRTLKTGLLDITPPELSVPWTWPSLKPEPIPVSVKVILIGDHETFALLDHADPDFPHLFKVLVDFDSVIPRDERSVEQYVGVLARIVEQEKLPHFAADGVAALVAHGARIAARRGKLSSRFGRLADVAREAAHLAVKDGRELVLGDDVRDAVARSKRRADLPSRKFREYVADGTIRVKVRGAEVGQINGLAVLASGPLSYGFPARITATIGPGTAGPINIEREAALSGAIHTKGFYILGGLLRTLLPTLHPLAFSASIAFEQSYGGIDGDSASGAEICCLLSALTEVPLRQELAMTGAIDQRGNILAIGAVNEKIEGFFDTCSDRELTGTQGVIIPRANAGDLMLRPDIVEAAREGRFHIYAVDHVKQALELFTGLPAGTLDDEGQYPEGSVLATAMDRAFEYWQRVAFAARLVEAAEQAVEEEENEVRDAAETQE